MKLQTETINMTIERRSLICCIKHTHIMKNQENTIFKPQNKDVEIQILETKYLFNIEQS